MRLMGLKGFHERFAVQFLGRRCSTRTNPARRASRKFELVGRRRSIGMTLVGERRAQRPLPEGVRWQSGMSLSSVRVLLERRSRIELSEEPTRRVLLLEAGPNHTSAETPTAISGKSLLAAIGEPGRIWPSLTAVCAEGQAPMPYWRGRGVGGSSAVNAQLAIRGLARDYDRWAAQGCNGWGWEGVCSAFERVAERIPAERRPEAEWSTFDRRLHGACLERGHPRCDSYETEGILGIAPAGLTRRDGRRVSTNDAYLEPARGRANLEIHGDVLVDRVLLEHGRATGVRTLNGDVAARRVIVSAGAIHSPAILLRSGLGSVRPSIGRNLAEHPRVVATLSLTPGIADRDGDTPSIGWFLR